MTNSKGKIMQLDDYQRDVAALVLDEGRTRDKVSKEYGHGWTTIDKWVSALMEERAAEHYNGVMEHAMEIDPEVSCEFVLDGGKPFDERIEEIRKQRDAIARLMEVRQSQTNNIADRVAKFHDEFEAKIEALQQEVAMLKRLVSEMHEVNGVLINLIEMR